MVTDLKEEIRKKFEDFCHRIDGKLEVDKLPKTETEVYRCIIGPGVIAEEGPYGLRTKPILWREFLISMSEWTDREKIVGIVDKRHKKFVEFTLPGKYRVSMNIKGEGIESCEFVSSWRNREGVEQLGLTCEIRANEIDLFFSDKVKELAIEIPQRPILVERG